MKIISLLCSLILFGFSCIEQGGQNTESPVVLQNVERDSIPDVTVSKDILMGRFDPKTHPDFVKIPSKYASQPDMYLQKVVLDSFISMERAAKQDGIDLKIISATRNFARQKAIWERKWEAGLVKRSSDQLSKKEVEIALAKEILQFSSMPGTSRHHWGTDIDINNLNDEYFLSGRGKMEYNWLHTNAEKFGFCQPYSDDKNRTGYNEEKWHWSFVPIANKYLNAYGSIPSEQIKGFEGDNYVEELKIIEKYVFGVVCFAEN